MRAFYCCIACIVVIDAEKVDRSWSTFTLSRRQRMSILDEITKEKQRVSDALGRFDVQREKLTSQLNELEATERVLARYSKGTQARKTAQPQQRGPVQRRDVGGGLQPQDRPAASVAHRVSTIRFLPWQPARRSKKSPLHARALARTMSAPRLPGTSGPAASKSAMGSSMPHSRLERSNTSQQSEAGTTRSRPAGVRRCAAKSSRCQTEITPGLLPWPYRASPG